MNNSNTLDLAAFSQFSERPNWKIMENGKRQSGAAMALFVRDAWQNR
jgi:hypothetical protein